MREVRQHKASADVAPKRSEVAEALPSSVSRSARLQSAEVNDAVRSQNQQAVAGAGLRGAAEPLPHLERIQAAFGQHDVGGAEAHLDGAAREASQALGAQGFAQGNQVAFAEAPSLHTAAHEAAHVVQQRAGVHLKSGVGQAGDVHERHADAVADKVVAGQSAEPLLNQYPQGGGSTDAPVQFDLDDEVCEAEPVEDTCWVDLREPKEALLNKIRDASWTSELLATFGATAHPDHQAAMAADVGDSVEAAAWEAESFADRIADCEDLAAVEALDLEFDAWRAEVAVDVMADMEDIVTFYRDEEADWLEAFTQHAEISKDPINANQSGNKAKLTLVPGMKSRTIAETSVSWTWDRTDQAKKDKVTAWTPAEQTTFKANFQKQLDDVWGTNAQKYPPFAVSAPKDFLLADQPEKWSDITSNFEAKISDAAPGAAHFAITALKEGTAEVSRSAVSGDGKSATFHFSDQSAGYDAKGKETGDQHTLAHEWTHMLGNPDEYAENSKSQTDEANAAGGASMGTFREHFKKTYPGCLQQFDDIIANKDGKYTKAQIDQAKTDKNSVENPYSAGTDGFAIYDLSRPNPNRVATVPDSCFAVRESYDPAHAQYLRPGAESQRGGTHISANSRDQQRLSDRGNQVRPYMREGVLDELNKMLEGQFTPAVAFEHNFKDMSLTDHVEVLEARINALGKDLAALQASLGAVKAPDKAAPTAAPAPAP